MRGFHNSSFDPPTLVLLETAFDEAWLTLKTIGNTMVKPDELARCVLRLATEGERDPVRLHDGALKGLIPATAWREASKLISIKFRSVANVRYAAHFRLDSDISECRRRVNDGHAGRITQSPRRRG
jgi:hypothetical protein